MANNMKKIDLMIVSMPAYVTGECPYCEVDFEVDYSDFVGSDYPCDWAGDTIECPNCEKEILIDFVDWD